MIKRLLICGALLLALPASAHASKTTCSSGKTDFAHGRTRIFENRAGNRWFICSARIRHPREFFNAIDSYGKLSAFRMFGNRVGYAAYWEDAVTAGWDAEWVDVRTGEARFTEVTPDTAFPDGDIQAVAVDADGSIAFIEQAEDEQVIGYARNGVHRLHAAKQLTTIAAHDVVPASLAYADGVVSWTTTSGATSSLPAT